MRVTYILKSSFQVAMRMTFVKQQSDHVTQCLSSALRMNSKLLTVAHGALNKLVPASPLQLCISPLVTCFSCRSLLFI